MAKLDLVLGNDITTPVAIGEFPKFGRAHVFDRTKIALVPDHFAPNKDIKAAIEALLRVKDDDGNLLFRNKKQWWAVFRVQSTFCQYPMQMNSFMTKVVNMEIDYGGNPNTITYASLAAAVKDVPLMASPKPSTWDTLKDKSDNYRQQYDVAEFLMQKLGIKS